MHRCEWAGSQVIYQKYHDEEWGVPVWDDNQLFAKLILDGFQAGLSWITILKKRDRFYEVFNGFDPEKIVEYDETKFNALMNDTGIIRNRLKIRATITNAQAFLAHKNFGHSFSDYLWSFVDGKPKVNQWKAINEVPAKTKESDAMSDSLKKLGFKFTGSTICYAFMQAVGMVNDHVVGCYRHQECQKL